MSSTEEMENVRFDPMVIHYKPRLDDIIGQSRTFADDFILAMNSEAVFDKMGIQPDKTFLISGPPGTGKSLGIESLINDTNKEFFQAAYNKDKDEKAETVYPNLVGMQYDIGKYGTAYINIGSRIAQGFFDECYRIATGYKTLLIFDEAENIFGKRADQRGSKEDSKLLDTIMKNMQKVHDTPNMYSVMMSNFPEAFDEASIRAGRIDKRYEFKLPELDERKIGYEHTINKINTKAGYQVVRCYNTDSLAELSNGYSYADIVESVNATVKKRALEIAKTRKPGVIPAGYVSQKRLEESLNEHNNSFKKEKSSIGF